MGAKTGAKAGRPLKQNGKTKVQEKEEEAPKGPDFSVLRKPVEISVSGLSEAVKVFQNSPPELHHLLSYECDVVYECKVCRNLFRSLANFISHKRVYCTQLHGNSQNNIFKLNKRVNDTTVIVEPESVRITRSREQWRTSDAGGAGDGKQVHDPRTRNGLAEPAPFRITVKKDLTSIVEKLMQKNSTLTSTETAGHISSSSEFYDNVNKELAERKKDAKEQTIHLEPIENTSYGVFQTVIQTSGSSSELIKSQVQDLHRIMSDTDAVLGPDGRVIENGTLPSSTMFPDDRRRKIKVFEGGEYNGPPVTAPESEVELFCNLCKEDFSSYKVLNHHMKSLHMTFRTFYPCPCCKLPLSNSWSVYRHLLKVHRKTNEQIRKLREKVMKRSFRKEVLQTGAQKLIKPNVSENPLCPSELIYEASLKSTSPTEEDSYKQWFGDHDDGLGQGCGYCGRRFDRRAALLAHSLSCMKTSSAKQSSAGSVRLPPQAGIGRPSQPNKMLTAPTSTSGQVSPLMLALRPSPTLPIHPMHLNQEKQAVPTKKIEIQIRRDYGKTLTPNSECRTRTSSASRSDDGAASVSRSDDGTTSGSSETEASGATDKGSRFQKKLIIQQTESGLLTSNLDHRPGRRPSLTDEGISKVGDEPPLKRRVGRPRKHRTENFVNGAKEARPPSVSISDGSDDSNDVKDKILGLSKREASRKRKAEDAHLSFHDESDGDITANSPYDSDTEHVSSVASKGSSKKVLCTICHKHFKSSISLRGHLAAVHISYNRFRCLICNFRSFSKMDCVSHALKTHLESSWDKDKAVAMVQDLQMDAGGSTDSHPYDGLIDSGDSESAVSDSGSPSEAPEKSEDSSPDDLPNVSKVENHSMEGVAEIMSVA